MYTHIYSKYPTGLLKDNNNKKVKTKTTPPQTVKEIESKLYLLCWTKMGLQGHCKLGRVAYEISEIGFDAY